MKYVRTNNQSASEAAYIYFGIIYISNGKLKTFCFYFLGLGVRGMVFNATFNNISVISWWFIYIYIYIYIYLESQDIYLFKLRRQHQYFNRTDIYSSHMDDSPLLYFHMKAMFGSSLPSVVCRRAHVLFTLFIIIRYTHFLPFCNNNWKRIPHALIVIKRCDLIFLYIQTLFFCSVLYTTLCDKVCQRSGTGLWFSPGTPVSFINTTDRHDMTEILLKVALITLN